MEWSDLRFVLAVSRHGSLSGASRDLAIDRTTVGRRITTIEATLGARLFDRTPDGYLPTAIGEVVLAHARSMEEHALSIEREVAGSDTKVSGVVRITAVDPFINELLLPNLHALYERHPELQVIVAAETRVVSLSRREADIAVRFTRPTDPDHVGRKLADVDSALYASRDYIARRGRPRDARDLAGHDLVRYAPELSFATEEQWLAEHAPGGRVVLRVTTPTSHISAIRLGLGIGIHECHAAERHPEIVRLAPEPILLEAWWAVVHVDMARAARVRATLDFLSDLAAANRDRLSSARSPSGARARKRPR